MLPRNTVTSKFLIYSLVDPSTGETRYVGKSSSRMRRPKAHAQPCQQKTQGHLPLYRWVRKLKKKGLSYLIFVLEESPVGGDVLAAKEVEWISRKREEGCRLLNLTDGGEGAPGVIVSEETRRKKSIATKGRVVSKETGRKISLALMGNRLSAQTKRKISNTLKGRRATPERRMNQSLGSRGRVLTEAHIAKLKGPSKPKKKDNRGGPQRNTLPPRAVVDDLGNRFTSVGEAARHYNVDRSLIRRVCQGKQFSARGRRFRYVESEN